MPVLDLDLHLGCLVGMLGDIRTDPGGKAADRVLNMLRSRGEIHGVERVVVEEAHEVIVFERPLPLHLGHSSSGLADGEVDVGEPILGLGIPERVIACRLGVGVDMRHAPGVAVERHVAAVGRCGCNRHQGGRPPPLQTSHDRRIDAH